MFYLHYFLVFVYFEYLSRFEIKDIKPQIQRQREKERMQTAEYPKMTYTVKTAFGLNEAFSFNSLLAT